MSLKKFWTASLACASVCVAALCACSFIVDTNDDQCQSTADCTKKGSAFAGFICSDQHVCQPQVGCSTNAECIDANGGKPFVCNKTTRACVSLQPDLADGGTSAAKCKTYAEALDYRNDDTVWVGAIIDTTSPSGILSGGTNINYMELARKEIVAKNNGIPSGVVGGKPRPLAFIHCESNGDPVAAVNAASFLADQVGVQLFIAGDAPTTAIPMTQNVLLPKKALNISIQNGGAVDLPPAPGTPRLFYSFGVPVQSFGNAGPVSIGALEQEARTKFKLAASDEVRFALVCSKNETMQAGIAAGLPYYKWNNKTILENGDKNFLQINYNENASAGEFDQIAQQLAQFKPHMISTCGFAEIGDTVVPVVDAALTKAGSAPMWLLSSLSLTQKLFTAETVNPDLQSRTRWISMDMDPLDAVLKGRDYDLEFNSTGALPPQNMTLTGFMMIPYDIMYLYAYAVAANGGAPVTGENIAKVLPRIFQQGAPVVQTGGAKVFAGFQQVQQGPIMLKGIEAFRGDPDKVFIDFDNGRQSFWPLSIYCPLSNGALPTPIPGLPDFAMLSGQRSGLSFGFPEYKELVGAPTGLCDKWAGFDPTAIPDGGGDAGGDGG